MHLGLVGRHRRHTYESCIFGLGDMKEMVIKRVHFKHFQKLQLKQDTVGAVSVYLLSLVEMWRIGKRKRLEYMIQPMGGSLYGKPGLILVDFF